MSWSEARITEMTRLWNAGVSASGIAAALGDVSRSAVLGKLHRLTLLRSRQTAAAPRRYDGPVRERVPASAPAAAAPAGARGPETAPIPPRSPWREAAFAPLPGAQPRPWIDRESGECAFPVGGEGEGLVSCCAAALARSAYCARHHRVVFRLASPAAQDAEARRWERLVEQVAA